MIYCLTGTLLEKDIDTVVLDVGGVGFLLTVPSTVLGVLPGEGERVTLYTYLAVKEDAMDLYGFATQEEQRMFKTLITVSGVGPKAGLAILSVLSPQQIAMAINAGDYKSFTAAQGIGPKVAQRITLELKGKFANMTFGSTSGSAVAGAVSRGGNVGQAISALVALGYSQSQSAMAVAQLDPTMSVQDLIRQGLKLIAGGKV